MYTIQTLLLTSFVGTVSGVPCLTTPPCTWTPTTIGSLLLKTQLGNILSLQGKTAMSLYCSRRRCFSSYAGGNNGDSGDAAVQSTTMCPPAHLPVAQESIKKVVYDVSRKDTDSNAVSILLCLALHTNIKGQDHGIPTLTRGHLIKASDEHV